jgi:hemolysin activation/secretion protein
MTLKILFALVGLPIGAVGESWVTPSAAIAADPAMTVAQTDTNAQNQGKTPISLPLPAPTPPESILAPESVATPETTPEAAPEAAPKTTPAAQVTVKRIEVIGSTVLSESTIAAIVKPFEGQSLTFDQLQGIADRLTQAYLQRGYLTSRALLKAQTIANGLVQIQILEGSLSEVEVIGTKRLSTRYIRQQIQPGIQTPLSQPRLEDQLRLLKLDPLLNNVEASIRQAAAPGQSILTVRVAEAPAVFGAVSLDNDSVPSVGRIRAGVTLGYRNLTGRGDVLYGSYYRSLSGGSDLGDFGYQIPLNSMQGSLQLRVAPSRYKVTDGDFKALDIHGSAAYYDINFRQPLSRSPRSEFALSLGFGYRTGQTLIADTLIDESVTSVVRLGQDWLKRDAKGFWSASSQFNLGTDWLGATQGRTPDGQFFSWTGQASRTQQLGPDHLLRLQANWQLTPDPLLPTQQFVLGGRQSLRGFRQNFRSSDNGVSLSIEHQVALQRNITGRSTLQLAPFIEVGALWNAAHNPTPIAPPTFLAGLGLGLRWQPTEQWDLRLDYGLPLVKTPEQPRDPALYFNLKYRF